MTKFTNIPKHWQITKLGEVCDKISLNGFKIKQKDYLEEGKYPVVDQGQELIGGYYNDKKLVVPNEPPYIIFGDHTKVKKFINFNFIAGADGVKVLKPYSIFDPKFFFYLIHTVNIPDKGYARHFQFLEKEEIPIPPLPEQQAIVSKIEELLSALENGKQQLQNTRQQLKVYRQSLLKWAFEGKLTRLNHDPSDLHDEHDLKMAAESQIEYIKNQGSDNLPEGWKWVTVKDICMKIVGGGTPSTKVNRYWNGDIPWISSADIYGIKDIKPRRKITNEAVENSAANLLPKGGIIVVTRVGLGKLAIAPFDLCFSQDSQGLVLNEYYILKEYALWVLTRYVQIFKHQSRGTTINGVTKKQLADLAFPLPPIEEQQLIVEELESKLTVCDKIEETISHSLQQAETLWQSILKKAFEGRLV